MSRITGYIQPARPPRVSFATVSFVKLGHDCDRQKFPTPPPSLGRRPSRSLTVTILRNGTSISRGWRRGEEVNRKLTHTYTFERAFPACFSGFWLKSKMIYSRDLFASPPPHYALPLPTLIRSFSFSFRYLPNSNVDSPFSTTKSITDSFFFFFFSRSINELPFHPRLDSSKFQRSPSYTNVATF